MDVTITVQPRAGIWYYINNQTNTKVRSDVSKAEYSTAVQAEWSPEQAETTTQGRKERIIAALGLLAVAIPAQVAHEYNVINDLPDGPEILAESLRHPIVGYIGAYTGAWLATKILPHYKSAAAFGAATMGTIANFSAESGQEISKSRDATEYLAFNRLPETAKDYIFALIGTALYLGLGRKNPDRESN